MARGAARVVVRPRVAPSTVTAASPSPAPVGATPQSPAAVGHPGAATLPPLTPSEENAILVGILEGVAQEVEKLSGPLGGFFRNVLTSAVGSVPQGVPVTGPPSVYSPPAGAASEDAVDLGWLEKEDGQKPPPVVTEVVTSEASH